MKEFYFASTVGDLKFKIEKIITSTRYLRSDVWFRRKTDLLMHTLEKLWQTEYNVPEAITFRSVQDALYLPDSMYDAYMELNEFAGHTY